MSFWLFLQNEPILTIVYFLDNSRIKEDMLIFLVVILDTLFFKLPNQNFVFENPKPKPGITQIEFKRTVHQRRVISTPDLLSRICLEIQKYFMCGLLY